MKEPIVGLTDQASFEMKYVIGMVRKRTVQHINLHPEGELPEMPTLLLDRLEQKLGPFRNSKRPDQGKS